MRSLQVTESRYILCPRYMMCFPHPFHMNDNKDTNLEFILIKFHACTSWMWQQFAPAPTVNVKSMHAIQAQWEVNVYVTDS